MSDAKGGRSSTALPILPPSATRLPACSRRWAVSAVVVDLPLVPVMTMTLPGLPCFARSRKNSSVSPITGTPASFAFSTLQCGLGWVSGTPGASTSAAKSHQASDFRSRRGMFSADAATLAVSLSSQAIISAPPAKRERAAGRPLSPRPNTAIFRPLKAVTGIMRGNLAQFKRGEAGKCEHHGDDPEADDHGRFRPAFLLEMMVQRRHAEHALAGEAERGDLHDHRRRLQHEQTADNGQHQLMLGRDRDGAERTA